jgi:predicted ArsR family transcriptional regulator
VTEGPSAAGTRAQILDLILSEGPVTAGELADRLVLAAAGVRRHLGALEADGLIEDHCPPPGERGRGRPSRYFVATDRARQEMPSEGAALAVELMDFLVELGGDRALADFAARRAASFEGRYAGAVKAAGDDVAARAAALVAALGRDGYAASLRPGPKTLTIQVCQGHCPVQAVARQFPQLCEEETAAISRMLGVHVQRLATLARGEHVCTTCVPVAPAGTATPRKENA